MTWPDPARLRWTSTLRVPSDEYRDGIDTQRTRSGPSASAARAAVTAESIPPDTPTTTPSRKPFLST